MMVVDHWSVHVVSHIIIRAYQFSFGRPSYISDNENSGNINVNDNNIICTVVLFVNMWFPNQYLEESARTKNIMDMHDG